jgi:mRNA-degrading endonuclease RelE of RelBE toxin-antitoxin system
VWNREEPAITLDSKDVQSRFFYYLLTNFKTERGHCAELIMITNRNIPRISDLIYRVPEKHKKDVSAVLDELENNGLSPKFNPKRLRFNKYKIEVKDSDIEIIFEHDFASGDIRIVDIKDRADLKGIARKILKAIEIGP